MPLQNQPSFLGVKKCGKQTNDMGLSWVMNTSGALAAALQSGVPGIVGQLGFANPSWYGFELDPKSIQLAADFGVGRTLQLQISRKVSYFVDATHNKLVGRTVIWCVASGQTIAIAPRRYISFNPNQLIVALENDNEIFPVEVPNSSTVQVWLEADVTNGAQDVPSTFVIAELFNFKLGAVALAE